MCAPKLFSKEGHLVGIGSTYKPVPGMIGPPILLYGATSLATSIDLQAIEANLGIKAWWRPIAITDGVPTDRDGTLSSEFTSADAHPATFDVSTAAGSNLLVQPAVFGALTTGTARKAGFGRFWGAVNGSGFLAARARLQLPPGGTSFVLPIGVPFPCVGVTGLMFAFTFYGINGTIDNPACVWRSYDSGDPTRPGPWSSALTTLTDVTGSIRVNSGSLAITTTDKLMVQAGLKFTTTATDFGVVDVVVAAK